MHLSPPLSKARLSIFTHESQNPEMHHIKSCEMHRIKKKWFSKYPERFYIPSRGSDIKKNIYIYVHRNEGYPCIVARFHVMHNKGISEQCYKVLLSFFIKVGFLLLSRIYDFLPGALTSIFLRYKQKESLQSISDTKSS